MTPAKRNLLIICLLFLVIVSGCTQKEDAPVDQAEENSELLFFDELTALDSSLQINEIVSVPAVSCEKANDDTTSLIFQADERGLYSSCDLMISAAQGLFFEFELEKVEDSDSLFTFLLQNLSDDEALNQQVHIDSRQVTIVIDNLPQMSFAFDNTLTWKANTPYHLLLTFDSEGVMSISIWEPEQRDTVSHSVIDLLEAGILKSSDEAVFQLGIWLMDSQGMKIDHVWFINPSNNAAESIAVEEKEQTAEPELEAEDAVSEEVTPTPEEEARESISVQNLADYLVFTSTSVEALTCSETVPITTQDEGYLLAPFSDNYYGFCELAFSAEEAFQFEFTSSASLSDDNRNEVLWVFREVDFSAKNGEDQIIALDLSHKEFQLKNSSEILASTSYENLPGIDAGVSYTMMLVFEEDGSLLSRVWPTDHPETVFQAVFTEQEVTEAFGNAAEDLHWQFGFKVATGQNVFLEQMYTYTLEKQAAVEEDAVEEPLEDGESVNDERLQALREYYVSSTSNIKTLSVCPNTLAGASGETYWESESDNLVDECEIYLMNGEALIYDFSFEENMLGESGRLTWVLSSQENELDIEIDLVENKINLYVSGGLVQEVGLTYGMEWVQNQKYSIAVTFFDTYMEILIWPIGELQKQSSAVISLADIDQIQIDEQTRFAFGISLMGKQIGVIENVQKVIIQ